MLQTYAIGELKILKIIRTFLEQVTEMQEYILDEEDGGAPLISQQVC